jgi:uncharacterized protein YjlB
MPVRGLDLVGRFGSGDEDYEHRAHICHCQWFLLATGRREVVAVTHRHRQAHVVVGVLRGDVEAQRAGEPKVGWKIEHLRLVLASAANGSQQVAIDEPLSGTDAGKLGLPGHDFRKS